MLLVVGVSSVVKWCEGRNEGGAWCEHTWCWEDALI